MPQVLKIKHPAIFFVKKGDIVSFNSFFQHIPQSMALLQSGSAQEPQARSHRVAVHMKLHNASAKCCGA